MCRFIVNVVLGVLIWLPVCCWAVTPLENYNLIIKDHKFEPTQITIPANQKIILMVENQDPTVEEFESFDFNREKVVTGNGKIKVFIGPLKAGQYKFFGDYHKDTAQGILIVQ